MEVRGTLANVRRYSFTDDKTGELIEGGKLTVIQEAEQSPSFAGLAVVDIPILYADFDSLRRQGEQHYGKPVTVECDLILAGKRPKLRALTIKGTLKAAA